MAIDPLREDMLAAISRGLYGSFENDQAPIGEFAARRQQALFDQYKDAPIVAAKGSLGSEFRNFMPIAGEKYRLVSDGKIVATANTPEEFQSLVAKSNEMGGGRDANIVIQKQNEGGDWGNYFENLPDPSVIGQIAKIGLPVALQFVPGLGQALSFGVGGLGGTMLGAGLTGALGGAAGGVIAGDPIGDILKNSLTTGAISGLAAGALNGIGGSAATSGGQGVGGGVTGSGSLGASLNVPNISLPTFTAPSLSSLGGSIGGGLSSLPGEIVVTAARDAIAPALSGALSGATGAGIGSLVNSAPVTEDPLLTVTAPNAVQPSPLGGVANIFGPLETLGYQPTTEAEEITVTGQRPDDPSLLGGISVPYNPNYPIPEGAVDALPDDTIDVVGQAPPPFDAALLGIPAAAAIAAPAVVASGGAPQGALGTSTPSSVAAGAAGGAGGLKLSDYLLAGSGGLSLLQGLGGLLGLGGGGNSSAGSGIGSAFGGAVSYQPLNRTQRPITFDPFTYGQTGGEFKFFNDAQPVYQTGIGNTAPQASIAPQSNKPPLTMKEGGHIRGIGGGQDDLIPARLSDGEYVISAQDVADLGDGSNEEGARKLDEMRRLIRKNAGRKNVKTIAKPQKSVSSLLRAVK